MSVGLQRLREEPDAIRRGRDRQGRGPGARRPRARARRAAPARSSARATRSRPSATRPVEADRRGDQRRRRPERPGGGRARRRASTAAGERIAALDAELAEVEAELEDRCCASRTRPTPTCRSAARRPTSRSGRGASQLPAREDGWTRKPHWELAEALGIIDNARGAKIAGSGFPVYNGAGSALQRAPDQLVPRRPHPRARHDRGLAAGRREHGDRRAGPARSRTRKTRCTSSPATTCTWSRPPRSRSRTSIATRSSTPRSCRSATPPTPRASAARPAPPARTPAASCASTSSTRSRWSCFEQPRGLRRRPSSG